MRSARRPTCARRRRTGSRRESAWPPPAAGCRRGGGARGGSAPPAAEGPPSSSPSAALQPLRGRQRRPLLSHHRWAARRCPTGQRPTSWRGGGGAPPSRLATATGAGRGRGDARASGSASGEASRSRRTRAPSAFLCPSAASSGRCGAASAVLFWDPLPFFWKARRRAQRLGHRRNS
eukprot:scaffold5362_cov100-Isochrysis_galbana.AAC.8